MSIFLEEYFYNSCEDEGEIIEVRRSKRIQFKNDIDILERGKKVMAIFNAYSHMVAMKRKNDGALTDSTDDEEEIKYPPPKKQKLIPKSDEESTNEEDHPVRVYTNQKRSSRIINEDSEEQDHPVRAYTNQKSSSSFINEDSEEQDHPARFYTNQKSFTNEDYYPVPPDEDIDIMHTYHKAPISDECPSGEYLDLNQAEDEEYLDLNQVEDEEFLDLNQE